MIRHITFGDMAAALHRLRDWYGLYYVPPEWEILDEARRHVHRRVWVIGSVCFVVVMGCFLIATWMVIR